MKKKVLAAMLVAAMTATMFAGCGSKDEGTTGTQAANNGSTSESAEPVDVKLTVMGPSEDQDDAQGAWLKTECEAFNEEHPEWNITFDYVTCSESDAKDTVLQDPASAADVYMFANDQIADLVDAGALTKLGGDAAEYVKSSNSEAMDAPRISAKTGLNIEDVLEQIVKKIPAPTGDKDAPLKALIFDATYDSYKGVIIFCRLREGSVKVGDTIKMMATGASDVVTEVGYFGAGQFIPCDELSAGMVGYIAASIKNVRDTRVGDTVTLVDRPCDEALPGYKKVNPMVYCGLYPADSAKYPDLRDALEKLQVNDASLQFEPETSLALGFGFRCGFLGLLHLEIIQERLEREFDLDLVTTAPSVIYKIHKTRPRMSSTSTLFTRTLHRFRRLWPPCTIPCWQQTRTCSPFMT